ncbi:Predicted kinase, aminoglycoside phosphotransferase (APT) family [Rhodococcus rhodochrous J3]|uniref:Phosphotransferase family protein n=2 Tax=Rhodococcus rhodochrous TaxID=1829 RepID=A0AA47A7R1_RHORH|nr:MULTISPECIES: phosphotransferase family protein [Rhodococcus]MCR8694886.1 phosphotransferase family protein [Rhodococcus pyridinivorans]AYA26632.1 phosphotransferase family protein [Rhodococcus rhodochrous]MBF4478123.1 phosphotransferase family protein [Rhodococcus rhodochrous]MCB8908686.1 phosphotransferase family protein [Rhodococcus rhodochrous]MCD2098727.1 phosphotransferase family protein [Rhodococcus rhodochrous]
MNDVPAGLDLDALDAYLQNSAPDLFSGPLRARLISGGRSNLTYEVTDGDRRLVLRRPPLGHVLATAHDMAREYRVISALAGTAVPVPRSYLLCEDDSVLGAPFYLMDLVVGTPYRTAEQLEPLGAERTRVISERMVDTLAALHAVDPATVGLEDFGRPQGFLERQVRRWTTQLENSHSRDLDGADELHRLLVDNLPGDGEVGIVHGDYRLDNVLVDDDDKVVAVLDWEMATLGDPLTDVALLLVYQRLAREDTGFPVSTVSRAPGFLGDDELLARYEAAGGRDLSDMAFHLALAYYKLAVILEGIYFRFRQGKTVGEGFEKLGHGVEPLLHGGIDALKSRKS